MQNHCPNLLSWERKLLAQYLGMSQDERAVVLKQAQTDPQVSGSLMYAYKWAQFA